MMSLSKFKEMIYHTSFEFSNTSLFVILAVIKFAFRHSSRLNFSSANVTASNMISLSNVNYVIIKRREMNEFLLKIFKICRN